MLLLFYNKNKRRRRDIDFTTLKQKLDKQTLDGIELNTFEGSNTIQSTNRQNNLNKSQGVCVKKLIRMFSFKKLKHINVYKYSETVGALFPKFFSCPFKYHLKPLNIVCRNFFVCTFCCGCKCISESKISCL